MDLTDVRYEKQDGIAWITIDRPERRNAFRGQTVRELITCFRDAWYDASVGVAVLTEFSPSCGSGNIYDGSFSRERIDGDGVTAALLRSHGIRVFDQHQLEQAIASLEQ